MFVTKKKFESVVGHHTGHIAYMERQIERLEKRAHSLEGDFELLKQYLGIEKEYTPAKTEYVQKTSE